MLEIQKCNVCGKIVMIIHNGGGTSVCCGQPMELQVERAEDQGKEKHVPVIEKTKNGIKVKVGAVAHPMVEDHHIEWIEIASGRYLQVKGLLPNDAPEAEFAVTDTNVKARAYCNKHGLWSNKPTKSKS